MASIHNRRSHRRSRFCANLRNRELQRRRCNRRKLKFDRLCGSLLELHRSFPNGIFYTERGKAKQRLSQDDIKNIIFMAYKYLPASLHTSQEALLASLSNEDISKVAYNAIYATRLQLENPAFSLALIVHSSQSYRYLPESLLRNPLFIFITLSKCGEYYRFIPEDFQKVLYFAQLAVVCCNELSFLGNIPENVRKNPDFWNFVLQIKPLALKFCPREILTKELCFIVVTLCGAALSFVPEDYFCKEILLLSLKTSTIQLGRKPCTLHPELLKDPDVLEAIFQYWDMRAEQFIAECTTSTTFISIPYELKGRLDVETAYKSFKERTRL